MRNIFLSAGLLLATLTANSASLKVIELSAAESNYELSKIQRIDFTNNESFNIIGKDGKSLTKKNYSETRVLLFDMTETEAQNVDAASVRVFPNPTQDALHISGAQNDAEVAIYNSLGQQVLSTKANDGQAVIEVSDFKKGTYVLRVGNKVIKFIKD